MDVACEKCSTVYELDESKLRPSGVTVKCTNCGHMFKIRTRVASEVESADKSQRNRTVPPRAASGGDGTWIVRVSDSGPEAGTLRRTSELATLQQWIVKGLVTRECEISRTGNTWKKLGSIPELATFFDVADEARQAREARLRAGSQMDSQPQAAVIVPPMPESLPSLDSGLHRRNTGILQPQGADPARAPTLAASPVDSGAPTMLSAPPGATVPPVSTAAPARARNATRTTGPLQSRQPRGGDGFGGAARLGNTMDEGPSGPTGGFTNKAAMGDAAFVKGPSGPSPSGIFAPTDFDPHPLEGRGGTGKWIVLGSLLLMAAAAAVVYLFVFRPEPATTAVVAVQDAGSVLAEAGDAAIAVDPVSPEARQEALAAVRAAIIAGSVTELGAAVQQLDSLAGDDDVEVLVARSQGQAALAQAATVPGHDRISPEAKEHADMALALAKQALELARNDAAANVAAANALRLLGTSAREVERYLRKAPGEGDAALVQALIDARENKLAAAQGALEKLAAGAGDLEAGGDPRPRYHLAVLALAADDLPAARNAADEILAVYPEHASARQLRGLVVAAESAVDTGDPMPPEDKSGVKPTRSPTRASGDSYDSLLAKATKLAGAGNCREAMGAFQQALDKNPAGVEALTGMGYCHIDQRQFASAHAKFKAALGISSRQSDALRGIAEAYRQQGLTPQAIAAYQRYLDENPSGPKAPAARRQLETLGGSSSEPAESGGGEPDPVAPAAGDPAPIGGGGEVVPDEAPGSDG